jgi:hypothetical protein
MHPNRDLPEEPPGMTHPLSDAAPLRTPAAPRGRSAPVLLGALLGAFAAFGAGGCSGCGGDDAPPGDPPDGAAFDGATDMAIDPSDGASGDGGAPPPVDGDVPDADAPDGEADDGGSPADGATADGAAADGGAACVPAACDGRTYRCGNCLDDDGDGLVDAADPDCLGPCHNSETTYYPMIPGGDPSAMNCGRDCYYDDDNGSGNDGCSWDKRCDPLSPGGDGMCRHTTPTPPSARCAAEQSMACLDFCLPRTPNGCDCFGCCELPARSGRFVFLGTTGADGNPSCTREHVDDPARCRPCMPHPSCVNPCERCELCVGRDPATIPADCFPPPPADGGLPVDGGPPPDGATPVDMGAPDPRCSGGRQPCGLPGDPPCPSGLYCLTGCCAFFG